jgi:hypothetical protein
MSQYGFSLTNGKRLAVLKNNTNKITKEIFLYNPKYVCSSDCKNIKGCKCSGKSCETLKYHDGSDENIYQKLNSPEKTKFMLAPTNIIHQVNNLFITGAQGSGKSVFCRDYLKVYKEYYKKAPVFLISEGDTDDVLDPYITKRIKPDDVISQDLKFSDFQDIAEEFGNLIIIFDDIDALPSDKTNGFLKKRVYALMNSIINNSRKYGISVLFTSHNAMEGNFTSTMIRSCSNWVFFTNTINKNIERCALTYFDFTLPQFKRLKQMAEEENSHWISVANTIPKCIITEKSIFKLEDL